jgi:hypothetical protein
MEFGLILKVAFFALWPFLLLLIYYLTNKKKFMAKWQKMKDAGFFSK